MPDMSSPAPSDDRLHRTTTDESSMVDLHVQSWRANRGHLRRFASESGCQRFLARVQACSETSIVNRPDGATQSNLANVSQLGIQPAVEPDIIGVLGPYSLLRQIGRGGMAVVYEALDSRIDRHVAIKIQLAAEEQSLARERFAREAKALARLSHPHILQIYDVADTATNLPYLVTEYASGGTLRDRMRAEPLSVRLACEIAASVAQGLAVAHQAGLVHRDIKPSNILIHYQNSLPPDQRGPVSGPDATLRSRGWVPKLADFGLARPLDAAARLTESSVIPGTPAYMSPEQIHDPHHIGCATDIYSLGVTLYEMLTGEVPFRGSYQAVLHQILQGEIPPPRRLNRDIPEPLETICLHAMDFEATKRYRTAESLADDLHRFLRGEPILARPLSTRLRWQRWCRRHKLAATLAGVIAALLLLGTLGGVFGVLSLRAAYEDSVQANTRLALAVKESDAAFALSQDTLQAIVGRVREDLYDVPQATQLVVQTSQDAAELHRRLLALRPDDLRSAKALVAALDHLANAEWVLGNQDKSRAATDELETVLEQTRRRHADDLELETAWCNHLISRVTFPAPGATEAKQKEYEDRMRLALQALQSHFPREPAVAKLAMIEAKCQATLAKKARDDQRLLEANQQAVRAAQRYVELAGPAEADEAKLWHAQTMRVMADYYAKRDLLDDAAAWYGRALERIETNPLVDSQREARYQAAGIGAGYGETLLKRQELGAAEQILDRSVHRFSGLATDFPEDFPYRRELVHTLLVRCRCRIALGNRKAATEDLDRAVEHVKQLPVEGLSDNERAKVQAEIESLRPGTPD